MRNSVSAVTGRLLATSAMPSPVTHSGPFLCTIAIETPGECVSFRIFSICCCSSWTESAGFIFIFFFLVRCQAERSNEEENDDSVCASQEGPSVRSRRERQAISAIHLTSEGTMQTG